MQALVHQARYFFPRVDDAEYLIVFTENDTYPLNQEQFDQEMEKYLNSMDWKIMVDEEPLLILKKENNVR